jgi:hypothetical protein
LGIWGKLFPGSAQSSDAEPVEGLDGRRLTTEEDSGPGFERSHAAIGRPVGIFLGWPLEEAGVEPSAGAAGLEALEAGPGVGDVRLAAVGEHGAEDLVIGALREVDECQLAVSSEGRSRTGKGSMRMPKMRLLSFWGRRKSRRHHSNWRQALLTRNSTASQRLRRDYGLTSLNLPIMPERSTRSIASAGMGLANSTPAHRDSLILQQAALRVSTLAGTR